MVSLACIVLLLCTVEMLSVHFRFLEHSVLIKVILCIKHVLLYLSHSVLTFLGPAT